MNLTKALNSLRMACRIPLNLNDCLSNVHMKPAILQSNSEALYQFFRAYWDFTSVKFSVRE